MALNRDVNSYWHFLNFNFSFGVVYWNEWHELFSAVIWICVVWWCVCSTSAVLVYTDSSTLLLSALAGQSCSTAVVLRSTTEELRQHNAVITATLKAQEKQISLQVRICLPHCSCSALLFEDFDLLAGVVRCLFSWFFVMSLKYL